MLSLRSYSAVNVDILLHTPGFWESLLIGVTEESFNLTCGCEALNDTSGESGCGSTGNFSITSQQLPTLEGCYLFTGNMNSTAFSQTGELTAGEVAVYMGYMNSDETDVSARRRQVRQGLPTHDPIPN